MCSTVKEVANHIRRSTWPACVILLVLALGVSAPGAQPQEELRVSLATKLGVETTVAVKSILIDEDILHCTLSPYGKWGWGWTLPNTPTLSLRVADGVYIAIPMDTVKKVTLSQGQHAVLLHNGRRLKGNLIGTIVAEDDRRYDLKGASKVQILSVPKKKECDIPSRKQRTWDLRVSPPQELNYSIVEPCFAFEYYSTSGYLLGGADRVAKSPSFYLKVGDDELLANVADFQEISFKPHKKSSEVRITLKAKSGTETTGTPVLKHKDDAGVHTAKRWVFMGYMWSDRRIRVVVDRAEFSLRSRPGKRSRGH